jgi:hypothetical protein
MRSRALFLVGTTVALVGGGFVLRSTAPAESVQAVSSVQRPIPERRNDSVSVLTEVVTAQTIASPVAPTGAPQPNVRISKPRVPKRSLLARLLLGDGDNRPQPFPRPGRTVSVKP